MTGSFGIGRLTADRTTRLVQLDAVAAELLDGPGAEAGGRELADWSGSMTQGDSLRAAIDAALAGTATTVRIIHHADEDEQARWFEFRLEPGDPGVVGVVLDVTEAVGELELAEAVIEGMNPDTMGAVDTEMRYLLLNEASRAQLHALYGRDWDRGDPVTEGMSDEMAAASTAVWQRALEGDSWVLTQAFGDAEKHTFESRFYPLRDRRGRIIGAAGWGRDVTERVEMTNELKRSNEALVQFAHIASHDLRAPLRGMSGYLHFALESLDGGDLDELRTMLERAEGQVARMNRLIDDLLAYSRLRSKPLEPTEVDLDALIDEVIVRFEPNLAGSGSTIVRSGRAGSLVGDRSRLRAAIANLVDNALKYTDDVANVRVEASRDASEVRIAVADDGIGIPAHLLERALEPFRRLHAESEYGGGTGLGLGIVAQVVEQHGGRLDVTSTDGVGSTFTMVLPTGVG